MKKERKLSINTHQLEILYSFDEKIPMGYAKFTNIDEKYILCTFKYSNHNNHFYCSKSPRTMVIQNEKFKGYSIPNVKLFLHFGKFQNFYKKRAKMKNVFDR